MTNIKHNVINKIFGDTNLGFSLANNNNTMYMLTAYVDE